MENMLTSDDLGYLGESESSDYLSEFDARKEAGLPSALDLANAAVETAEAALGILTGDREAVEARLIADAHVRFKRVREAAALTARLLRADREDEAAIVAAFAEDEAASLRAVDPSKFGPTADHPNGLAPVGPFADGRKGRIARRGGRAN